MLTLNINKPKRVPPTDPSSSPTTPENLPSSGPDDGRIQGVVGCWWGIRWRLLELMRDPLFCTATLVSWQDRRMVRKELHGKQFIVHFLSFWVHSGCICMVCCCICLVLNATEWFTNIKMPLTGFQILKCHRMVFGYFKCHRMVFEYL